MTITEETDRIYLESPDDCIIRDLGYGRSIRIAKSGSLSTVVWNPWVEKSKLMRDFADDEYPEMLCIETTNAADDVVRIEPGAEHRLTALISVE